MASSEQKDSVYKAVIEVFNSSNINFIEGMDARQLIDRSLRKDIIENLMNQFQIGQIPLSSKQNDLKEYVSGLLSNWLRKDLRLNGGMRYKVKSPGVRKGQQDPLIKNLRTLQSTLEPGSQAFQATQSRIEQRLVQIKVEQAPAIDRSAIPVDLQQYIPRED